MTKAEEKRAKRDAARIVRIDIGQNIRWAMEDVSWHDSDARDKAEARERARLYRVALRAVREEVRRGQ